MNHALRSRRPLGGSGGQVEGDYVLEWPSCGVMGIINVTPDSFSDGGVHFDSEKAVESGLAMAEAGALFLDVGGESTRPGADPVPVREELRRVLPVVERLAGTGQARVSVDTSKPEVAREAVAAGAVLVNDVRGLRDPLMLEACAELGVPVIAMHMQGEPRTMQRNPSYVSVTDDVAAFLAAAAERARRAGIPDVLLDPGIGFGKTVSHNLALIRATSELASLGKIVIGASRKSFMAGITGEKSAARRDPGSIAVHLRAAELGAALVRVHDVAGHVQALRVWRALLEEE